MNIPILVEWELIKDYMALHDIVQVVRCEDCKHRNLENNVWTCVFGLPSGPDGYCSYGEREKE